MPPTTSHTVSSTLSNMMNNPIRLMRLAFPASKITPRWYEASRRSACWKIATPSPNNGIQKINSARSCHLNSPSVRT